MEKLLAILFIGAAAFMGISTMAPQAAAAPTEQDQHSAWKGDTHVDDKAAKAAEDDAKKYSMAVEEQAKASVKADQDAKAAGVKEKDQRMAVPAQDGGALHLAAVAPKAGLTIRGIKMPDDCQDPNVTGLQNMVTYVKDHANKNDPAYVADSDVDDYVCGWN